MRYHASMFKARFDRSVIARWFWFAAFDPRVHVLSVMDDFGNLVPVHLVLQRNLGITLQP